MDSLSITVDVANDFYHSSAEKVVSTRNLCRSESARTALPGLSIRMVCMPAAAAASTSLTLSVRNKVVSASHWKFCQRLYSGLGWERKEGTYAQGINDLTIARSFGFQASIDGIEPPVDQASLILDLSALAQDVLKEQLLRENATRGINRHLLPRALPLLQLRSNVGEERRRIRPRLIPVLPQVALEVLQVGDLDIAVGQIFDVRLQSCWGGTVFCGKGVFVWLEIRIIPLPG